jgi:hypothetical protein
MKKRIGQLLNLKEIMREILYNFEFLELILYE